MREIKFKLPELSENSVKRDSKDMLRDVNPNSLLDMAEQKANSLRTTGLNEEIGFQTESKDSLKNKFKR